MPNASSRTERPLLDALRSGVLVTDGAMGTQLYERGVLFSACFEELNLSRPELVAKVHEDYLRAGSQLIESNTFGANALRLEKYGLQARVAELNAAGVRVARAAAGAQAYVAGAMGPSGYFFGEAGAESGADLAKVREVLVEQARALVEAGVDALVLETFRQTPELRVAIEAALAASEGRVPIVASVSSTAPTGPWRSSRPWRGWSPSGSRSWRLRTPGSREGSTSGRCTCRRRSTSGSTRAG
jgi:homocysteine S-methyltransferase